jgi:hypothetical protein
MWLPAGLATKTRGAIMPQKITKRSVDQSAANRSGAALLWDSDVKGFGPSIRRKALCP